MHDHTEKPQHAENQKFMRVEKAAALIDVSPETIRKLIKQRSIRVYRFGRAVRIRESDIFLENDYKND
jgi:excisionase family DNA binding protein